MDELVLTLAIGLLVALDRADEVLQLCWIFNLSIGAGIAYLFYARWILNWRRP